jgi:hypothetical protein
MAAKSLHSRSFIPFHRQAAQRTLTSLEPPLQSVTLALMRVSGLGFLVVGLLLTIFPVVNYFRPHKFAQLAIPAVCLVYCAGLSVANYSLHKQTKAATPWKAALAAAVMIAAGMVAAGL